MSKKETRPLGALLDYLPPGVRPDGRMLYGMHVNLQPLDMSLHGAALWQAFSADKDGAIWDYMPNGPFASELEMCESYEQFNAGDDPHFYAIIPKSSDRAEGVASYLNIAHMNGSIEIGHINMSPALQATTASTEALFLMMRHAMDDLGNRRLEWKCNSLNAPSRRAAERLGFTYEGVFRQHLVVKGRNRDTAWYALIDKEWPALREAFFAWLAEDNFDPSGKQKKSLKTFTAAALKKLDT